MTSGVGLRGQRGPGGTIYDALVSDLPPATRHASSSPPSSTTLCRARRRQSDRRRNRAGVAPRSRDDGCVAFSSRCAIDFDRIFIDCPPSLGLLTLNALVAADTVLIPLHCEYFALEGLAALVSTLRRVRASLNPSLDIEGVLLTMHDERTNLGQQVARDVREFFKEKVYRHRDPAQRAARRSAEPRQARDSVRREIARRGGVFESREGDARVA